jgi:hypothetical protein
MDGDAGGSRVPHAACLLEFVEAALDADTAGAPARLQAARAAVTQAISPEALVDAAATVASFNAVVRIADGSGIPLEDVKAQSTADLRASLGIDRLRG